MNKFLTLVVAVIMMASCSSPKYTYHFDHYDYNSGKKNNTQASVLVNRQTDAIFSVDQETLVASADKDAVLISESVSGVATESESVSKAYKEMSKGERKEFRRELREEMKNYSKTLKSGDGVASAEATKAMDKDLKMAIIFGAVGLTLNLFGGVNSVFWVLGVIAIVIGVVFFVRWVTRQ